MEVALADARSRYPIPRSALEALVDGGLQDAEQLGIALQLINILRDVREDWELGRVYLPQDELAAYGVTEDDIAAGRASPEWRSLMSFQAARARAHLDDGLRLLDSLDRRSALCVATFA